MNINFTAPINSLSYGLVGLNVLLNLVKAGHSVAWFPIGQTEAPPETHEILKAAMLNGQCPDFDAPSVRLFHENSLAQHIGRGKRIGWPIFEVNSFDRTRKQHLMGQDELIVCSKWAKNVCRDNHLSMPIHVVPLGVDTNIFFPKHKVSYPDGPTYFIHIGKREYRKSQYEMLQCFEKAFQPNDNVKLIVIWGSQILQQFDPKEHARWTDLFTKSKMAHKIELIEWVGSQQEVAFHLCAADCGLFLSKSEGFNLGLLESMAMGNHNIVFNVTGPTEFITQNDTMLVESTGVEPIYDGVWFKGGDLGTWHSFGDEQIEQTINYMRNVHVLKQAGVLSVNKNAIARASEFTWEQTARDLIFSLGE